MGARAADGRLSTGRTAAESLRGGPTGEGLPVLFMGRSRGTMASGWAMAMNFDLACTYDEPAFTCRDAQGAPSAKGPILLSDVKRGVASFPKQKTTKKAGRGPGLRRDLCAGGRTT